MKRIFAHHICDWLVPTTDMLLDRGMMGDGVIDLKGIRAMIEAAGYHGPQEVEIFSRDNWWKRPGDEVVRDLRRAVRAILLRLLPRPSNPVTPRAGRRGGAGAIPTRGMTRGRGGDGCPLAIRLAHTLVPCFGPFRGAISQPPCRAEKYQNSKP